MPKPVKVELPQSQVTPDPALEKRGRRGFSAQYKIRIVAEADACKHGELTQLLRRETLYSNQVIQWRKELEGDNSAKLAKSAPGPKAKFSAEQKEIARLEKQVKRLERELDLSNRCIELQKKPFGFSICTAARASNESAHGTMHEPRHTTDSRLRCVRREPQYCLFTPVIGLKRRAARREPLS